LQRRIDLAPLACIEIIESQFGCKDKQNVASWRLCMDLVNELIALRLNLNQGELQDGI
jgi:hypothetical protein